MRRLILGAMSILLDVVVIITIISSIALGALGLQDTLGPAAVIPGAVLGLLGGLLLSAFVLGGLYLLVDIRDKAVKIEEHLRSSVGVEQME